MHTKKYFPILKKGVLVHDRHFIGKHMFCFSLDVEGAEFAILLTIPWDKVDIQVGSQNFN